ncbi:helix-turn-helix domain-containing protein [Patulibacter minatonensis]|uniref:helix-turn-helix domain-containing protein n=1 Tax=Patulibacter minatonensis TaxID=298163 RepID=UPI0004B252A9|nr:helix-turn-helix domain-containing protein [Patulibacter minatonensis]
MPARRRSRHDVGATGGAGRAAAGDAHVGASADVAWVADGDGGAPAAYGEVTPPPALADRVTCLWWVQGAAGGSGPRTDAPPAPRERVAADVRVPAPMILPDGCVDLVWHAGRLTVAGPDTAARPAEPGDDTTVGVRLRPGAATTFGTSASALRDEHPDAEELWGTDGRRLTERVAEQGDVRGRLRVLTAAVAARAADAGPTDPQVDAAAEALSAGRMGVAELARETALSERQLRRRFHHHVGYGPKTLERVLRLQRFLGLAIATDEDLAGLAALAGYADQGHLGRETRALALATPAELVAARRPGQAARGVRGAASRPVGDAVLPCRSRADVSETSETPAPRRGRMAA